MTAWVRRLYRASTLNDNNARTSGRIWIVVSSLGFAVKSAKRRPCWQTHSTSRRTWNTMKVKSERWKTPTYIPLQRQKRWITAVGSVALHQVKSQRSGKFFIHSKRGWWWNATSQSTAGFVNILNWTISNDLSTTLSHIYLVKWRMTVPIIITISCLPNLFTNKQIPSKNHHNIQQNHCAVHVMKTLQQQQQPSEHCHSHGDDGGHVVEVADGHPDERDAACQEKSPERLTPFCGDGEKTQEGNDAILSYGLQQSRCSCA